MRWVLENWTSEVLEKCDRSLKIGHLRSLKNAHRSWKGPGKVLEFFSLHRVGTLNAARKPYS